MSSKLAAYFRRWGVPLVGLTALLVSLPLYESWSNRPVLGRWSHAYTVFMGCAFAAWAGFVALSWRSFVRNVETQTQKQSSTKCLHFAILFWGIAYLLSAMDSFANAGRILELNLVGSTYAPAAILEWLAIVAFFLSMGWYFGPRIPDRWVNAGVFLATLVVLVVAGEGISRAKALLFPQTQGFPTYSEQLWARRYVDFNTAGFRDSERALVAAPGTSRALIVGDSYAFGVGVPTVDGRFGEQFEERLNSESAVPWEVMNTSLGDTHTLEHIRFLTDAVEYGPDLVVLIYVFNDIDYLVPVTSRPTFLGSRISVVGLLFTNSYLFQELVVRIRQAWYAMASRGGDDGQDHYDPYKDEELLQAHLDDLGRFVAIAAEGGRHVRILPFDLQIGPASFARYQDFVRLAASSGLPVCSIGGAFEGISPEQLRVNNLDGHPNANANRIAVAASFDCLTEGLPGTVPGGSR